MTLSLDIARFASALDPAALPDSVRHVVRRLIVDVVGLCAAARNTDYVQACVASAASTGPATAIGHSGSFGPYDAALINGTAAHGEDYDDTFEGGPVHAGAVMVPAVLAAAEQRGIAGDAAVCGIAAGVELMCRMSLVAPQAIHKACFHPTAVIGAPAAALAVGTAMRLAPEQLAHALGIAGSLASGIIEYLADGSSTKRLHAGAAAQAGIRAAFLAAAGFTGPMTVFEGRHGFYKAFAPSRAPDFAPLQDGWGSQWLTETLAFKPYACGTMTQPYIDCAIELARQGVRAEDIVRMECEVGEGTVHRLWEPLALKQTPPNGYAGKFSTPFCIAVGFLEGKAGFEQFTDAKAHDRALRALAAKISYVIDPQNPYPREFTGHVRAHLKDGSMRELRKPHMRGGAHEPLSDSEIETKYRDNARFAGWEDSRGRRVMDAVDRLLDGGPAEFAAARG